MGETEVNWVFQGTNLVWPLVSSDSDKTITYYYLDNSGNTIYSTPTYGEGIPYDVYFADDYYPPYSYFLTTNGLEEPYVNADGEICFTGTLLEMPGAFSKLVYPSEDEQDTWYLYVTSIPDSVTNMDYTFAYNEVIKGCVLPSGVTSLVRTFTNAVRLTGCTVPEGVTTLEGTFYACSSLEYLSLPSTLTQINGYSITDTQLEEIVYNSTMDDFYQIDGYEYITESESNLLLTRIVCTDGIIYLTDVYPDYIANGDDSTSGGTRSVYFNTGVLPTSGMCLEVKSSNINFTHSANQVIIGATNASAAEHFEYFQGRNATYHICYMRYNGHNVQSSSSTYAIANSAVTSTMWMDSDYKIHLVTDYETLTGTTNNSTTAPDYPLYLFARDLAGTAHSATYCCGGAKIYYIKIYDEYGGTLLHHFVPVLTGKNKVGFKDLVDETYIYNLGEDDITYGYEET